MWLLATKYKRRTSIQPKNLLGSQKKLCAFAELKEIYIFWAAWVYIFLDPSVQPFSAPEKIMCALFDVASACSLILIPEFFLKLRNK